MKSKYSAQQITEMEEAKQKETRNTGFALMGTRDSGVAKLDNGVVVRWPTGRTKWRVQGHTSGGQEVEVGEHSLPAGTFMINGVLYDADELRKWLRWA